ncbi:MAG: aminoacyl-tRNA hydrolase [Campylobacteraceae bacterium]|jgi:PTH1 family peptidyl-tRNA hydrolase|nr:aminoacyl-tRNA hydrolase [Campylobacteraceae bacterium]
MFLFVGLGNPAESYANTRHNIGFRVIDALSVRFKASHISKPQFFGALYKASNNLFLKPLTFMNNSGKSVESVVNFYKPEEIAVIHDDIAIPFGSVRIKRGGTSGGHNGLKSIDSHIKADYIRVRLGIGAPKTGQDAADFVLSDFSKDELPCVEKLINYAVLICEELLIKSFDEVNRQYTSKKGICAENG